MKVTKERTDIIRPNLVQARERYYIALQISALGFLLILIASLTFGQASNTGSAQTDNPSTPAVVAATAARQAKIDGIQSSIRKRDASAVGSLTQTFDLESDSSVRVWILHGLSALNRGKGVPFFEKALHDDSPEVRAAAVLALGQQGGPRATQDLIGALAGESNAGVRLAIAFWLGVSKYPASAAALGRLLTNDTDPNVRIQAARSLKTMGTSAAQRNLRQGLNDSDARVRGIANE